jgi:hypothetical protein
MFFKSKLIPLATAIVAATLSPIANSAIWSDSFIGLTQGTKFKEPGSPVEVEKTVVTLQYVGGYKYGVNFFSVDMLQSDHQDPAKGPTIATPSGRGAQEVYATYSNTLSFGKLGANTKFGPIRDIGFQGGFDFNSKNDTFGAGLVKFIAGPKVEFDVNGLLTLGLLYCKENNNNGFTGKDVNFDGTGRLATVWNFNYDWSVPVTFKGWATYTQNKGLGTAPETWLESSLLLDLAQVTGQPKTFYAGVGYQYIKNKFGNQPSFPGTKVNAPSLKMEIHF